MQDYRSVPLEVLRDFARAQSETTSIRAAADEAGLSHSAFHKFATGRTNPQPRVRRLLGLWYLAKQNEAADIDVVRPYASALFILLSAIPAGPERDAAHAEAIASLHSIYSARAPVPRWLELLLNLSAPGR